MKNLLTNLSLLSLLLCPMSASAVFIDFESFDDKTNIDGLDLGGVTLTSPGNNNVIEVYDNRFGVSSNSPTKAIANFTINENGSSINTPLIGTFDSAVNYVSLWAGDTGGSAGDLDSWTLNLFDAKSGGNLIASLLSPIWSGSPYSQLEIAAENIYRFEAIWSGPGCCGIGYDDLRFNIAAAIPAPLTAGLFGIGSLMLLSAVNTRRKLNQ